MLLQVRVLTYMLVSVSICVGVSNRGFDRVSSVGELMLFIVAKIAFAVGDVHGIQASEDELEVAIANNSKLAARIYSNV